MTCEIQAQKFLFDPNSKFFWDLAPWVHFFLCDESEVVLHHQLST